MNKFETNHIVLITVLKETRKALHQQLTEMVGDLIDIESFSVEESIPKVFHSTLIVLPNTFTIETVKRLYWGKLRSNNSKTNIKL